MAIRDPSQVTTKAITTPRGTKRGYIYGPGGLPVEQINSKGKTLYLHHDQQGSTRMLTDTTGTEHPLLRRDRA